MTSTGTAAHQFRPLKDTEKLQLEMSREAYETYIRVAVKAGKQTGRYVRKMLETLAREPELLRELIGKIN